MGHQRFGKSTHLLEGLGGHVAVWQLERGQTFTPQIK